MDNSKSKVGTRSGLFFSSCCLSTVVEDNRVQSGNKTIKRSRSLLSDKVRAQLRVNWWNKGFFSHVAIEGDLLHSDLSVLPKCKERWQVYCY